MDRIGEPFRSAERIRDALRNDRILVVSRIADKGPAVAKSLAEKVRQIAGASVGDPSLLRDGLTYLDRIALETYRDARAAMALIRSAVEDRAPPGSVAREDFLTPEFTLQAAALVRGIYAIAGRSSCASRAQSSTSSDRDATFPQ